MGTVSVLRMGHRFFRDSRVTTHVCLTARALGASKVTIADRQDKEVETKIREMVDRFGGDFQIETGRPWRHAVGAWKRARGVVVHLTAYGLPLPNVIDDIRDTGRDVLVVVGSEKMPREMFKLADWNVSVTNQPMSEVAALAVFLDWFHGHREFDLEFPEARIRITPSKDGKKIQWTG